MHVNQTTQATLSSEIIDRITGLDEMLKLALTDQDDYAELQGHIAALDPSEVKHILAIFGAKPAIAVEQVAVEPAEAVKDTTRHDA